MSTQLTHNQVLELLPLYVLGALEPEELLAMELYIQNHPELLSKLQLADEALAQLAYTAPAAALPADGKMRLLARVQADLVTQPAAPPIGLLPQVTQAPPAEAPPSGFQDALGGPRLPSDGPVPPEPRALQPTRSWRSSLSRRAIQSAGALAAILLLLLLGQMQARLSQTTAQISQLQAELAQLNARTDTERRVLALLANADQSVSVPGTALAPQARATFFRSGAEGVLVVAGLPQLAADKTYQLWLVVDGQPTPVGLLENPPSDGPSFLLVAVRPELQNFAIVDVSIEQAGGSQTITKETIVLRGQVEPAPQALHLNSYRE